MRAKILCLCLAASIPCAVSPGQRLPERSARVSSYEMQVRLLPETKTLEGTQRITWRNGVSRPTRELWLHLYLNAFRDTRSTFMRESAPSFREQWRDGEFGEIVVEEIALLDADGAQPHPLDPQFRSPDDDNPDDRTVVRVDLPRAVGPGESITLTTRFRCRMPKAYRRTGWVPDDGFFCMHWFPKLGVLEQVGDEAVWNCHQFHANTEFYADYSEYRVSIDTPLAWVVGATGGVPVTTEVRGDRRTSTFVQADVHDFAWVADPDFVVHEGEFGPLRAAEDPTGVAPAVARRMGVPVESFDLPRTRIRLLLQPEHDSPAQVRRHLEAVECGLEFFGLRYGPYPYPVITAVDPGSDVLGRGYGGGMEYPTLITCGTPLFPHARSLRPEGVTVHEFGHQYWYGLSGNNEFEHSWLDEGINTFSEGRAQYLRYDAVMRPVHTTAFGLTTLATRRAPFRAEDPFAALRRVSLRWLPERARDALAGVGVRGTVIPESPLLDLLAEQPTASGIREVRFEDSWNDRDRMLSVDNPDPMVVEGWRYLSRESYGANSYQRPATLLRTLERMVGRDAWWTFLRRFHATARFGHPTTQDFVAMLEVDCGAAAAEFFRAATAAGAVFDYGVERVSPADGDGETKTVVVRRWGGVRADVRVRLRFAGREQPVWREFPRDVDAPWLSFTFEHDERGERYGRLLEVWVDPPSDSAEDATGPAGVHLIDANLLNNGWRAEPDRDALLYRGLRALMQAQSRLMFAGVIG